MPRDNGQQVSVVRPRVFLLSPANASGERARMMLSDRARFDLAVRLRTAGAPLGEVFSFVSGLYFRGKIAYSERFASPPPGLPASLVITPSHGMVPPDSLVTLDALRDMAAVPIDKTEERYVAPLRRHARLLDEAGGPDCDIILLGSVATPKYVEPLLEVFGPRLLFPVDFVGRGDMSRGGLLLRCSRSGVELPYVPVAGATRHGPRPPKLPKLPRREA
jgi:hypothetical protein